MSRKKLLIACAVFAVLILIGGLLVSGQSGLWFQPSNNSDNHTYMHHAKLFGYFGVFSGAVAGGPHFTLAGPDLYQAVLMVGCGEEDMAYNNSDIGLIKFQNELRAAQIPFTPYFVTGAHDWFAWPQLFAHFAGAVLWR